MYMFNSFLYRTEKKDDCQENTDENNSIDKKQEENE